MKIFLRILVTAVVIIVTVAVGKNYIATMAVTGGVKAMTGLDLRIASMDVGVFKSVLGIHGLQLQHPEQFPQGVMIDVPEIYVDYHLGDFLQHKVHLEEVRLHLREFVVVKNAQGDLNLDALKAVKESKAAASEPLQATAAPEIQIDVLQLIIGTVMYRDYSQGGEPKVRAFPVHIDKRYEHITDPKALTSLIITQALMRTSIATLTNFDIGPLQEMAGVQVEHAKAFVGTAVDKAGTLTDDAINLVGPTSQAAAERAKSVAGSAAETGKEVIGVAGDALLGATDSIKNVLPFGRGN